jgi:hypothetical protein
MSGFCGSLGNVPSFTTRELTARYISPLSILPDSMPQVNELGLVDPSWLDSYMITLKSQKKIPTPPELTAVKIAPFNKADAKDPMKKFIKQENEFVNSIKAEYCWYEKRYFSALDTFITALTATGTADTTAVDQSLRIVKELNQKLNLLIQITNRISKFNYTTSQEYENTINSINNKLEKRGKEITEQSRIFNSESAKADIHKRMVEYTKEKNKANHNLLALYGVLNLVALGILIYVSK